jgi:YD repeat-containing protein
MPLGIAGLTTVRITLTDVSTPFSVNVFSNESVKSVLARLADAINATGQYHATAGDGYLVLVSGDPSASFVATQLAGLSDRSYSAVGLTNSWTIDPLGRVTVSDSNIFMTVGGVIVGQEQQTTYDDGSFSQMITGVGGKIVPGYNPSNFPNGIIPGGGSETVKIAQHYMGDSNVWATESFSDFRGRLTDVWQPEVIDRDPLSLSYKQSVRPHSTYGYDLNGNQSTQVDAKGRTTLFGYDDQGRELSRTLPAGESESFTYDAYGRQSTHVDFKGNIATSTYYPNNDPHAGMLQQVVYAGAGNATQTVGYTYDTLGRLKTVDDASGLTTDYYDPQGNLIEQDTPEGVIYHDYDAATGRLTSVSTSATAEAYRYDALGRLSKITVNKLNGLILATPLVTAYRYDSIGNKLSETLPDQELTQYTYDTLNRLKTVVKTLGGTTLFSQSFILYPDGTRHSLHEVQVQANSSTVARDTTWVYDPMNRLQSEVATSTTTTTSGSTTTTTNSGYSNNFEYDLVSNRISQTHLGPDGGFNETITSNYNADDQLQQTVSSLHGTTTNIYDQNGSLTSSSNGGQNTTYTFDARNKMIGYMLGSTQASYTYNDAGQRVQELANGITTFYLTDTINPTGYAQPIEERSSAASAPSMTYLIGDHAFGQVTGTGAVSYLTTDGHGSTRSITNSSGNVLNAFAYDAFGGAIEAAGLSRGIFRLTVATVIRFRSTSTSTEMATQ